MEPYNPFNIGFIHIGERNKTARQKRHAIVVIADVQGRAHPLRHLRDKAEYAIIATLPDAVKNGRFHRNTDILAEPLLKVAFLQRISFLYNKTDILIGKGKIQVNEILHLLPVDGYNRTPCAEALFFGTAAGCHSGYNRFRLLFLHTCLPLYNKKRVIDKRRLPSGVAVSFLLLHLQ